VANRARDRLRADKRHASRLLDGEAPPAEAGSPEDSLICAEQAYRIYEALSQVPSEQREVIALRVKAGMRFNEIAKVQGASLAAVQARYRRGIDRLRSILNGRL